MTAAPTVISVAMLRDNPVVERSRESGYYDNNIVPILALMNVVAISVLTFDDSELFYRVLITLNIAFVQMGIRMMTDNHLPNVEYEIRLQRILNEFFVVY